MIPLYGFLAGDTIGLLLLADPDETIRSLAERLQSAASVRVAPRSGMGLRHDGRVLDQDLTVAEAGLQPLDRVDVAAADEGGLH